MKDQIEMLTTERNAKSPTGDASSLIDTLPVQVREQRNSLLDSVANEHDQPASAGENPRLARFETALSWIAYAAVILVAGLVTWSVGENIMRYMAHH